MYGASLILLYGASTLYHSLPLPDHRLRPLRTLDHIAIYFLIAGTYTPVAMVTLHGPWGWTLLGAAWAIAVAGIPFKIWFLDAPVWISTGTYLAMGYMALAAAAPLAARVVTGGAGVARSGRHGVHGGCDHLHPGASRSLSPACSGITRSGICSCWWEAGVTSGSCSGTSRQNERRGGPADRSGDPGTSRPSLE